MSEPEPMTLKDWAERMANMPIDVTMFDDNAIMEDMLRLYGPFKPWPWYKRWAANIGDCLIRIGQRLGGTYE